MLTRRRLLTLLPAAAVSARLAPAQFLHRKPPPHTFAPAWVYIGTDTAKPGARGIYRARFDPNKGTLTTPELAAATTRAAWLAVNEIARPQPTGRRRPPVPPFHVLYCCNEGTDAQSSFISTFSLDPASGALNLLSQVSAGGAGPCYLSVDPSGRSAYVADYAGGMIASYAVHKDGTLSEPVDRVDFHNTALFGEHGPNKLRQDGPHPHSATLSPDDRFIVVNDLGDDSIDIFPIDATAAHLGPPHRFSTMSPGSGPRHIAFHPNGRWAYGIDELANRIDCYLYTSTRGAGTMPAQALLTAAGQSVSTIDRNFRGGNTAAEIAITPLGDYLYASNRGEDSLVVFSVSESDGRLTFVQRIACGGRTPRQFTLDRSGNWLLCGNQDSASVTLFARDPGTGKLSGPTQTVPVESPMYTLLV